MDLSYDSDAQRLCVNFNGETLEQRTAVINNMGKFMPGLQEYSASPMEDNHEIVVGLPFCAVSARFILEKAISESKKQF